MVKQNEMQTSHTFCPHYGTTTRVITRFKGQKFEFVSFRPCEETMRPSAGIEIYICPPDEAPEFLRYAVWDHTDLDMFAIQAIRIARKNAERPDIAARFAALELG